jgi:hypothetical protein
MRRLSLRVMIVVALSASAAAACTKADDWRPHQDADGRYRVSFPGKPQETKQSAPSPIGQLDFVIALLDEPGKRRAFTAFAMEYKLPPGTPFDVERGLDGGRDQMLANMGVTMDGERRIELAGVKGREVRYRGKAPNGETMSGIARIWAREAPPTVYQANALFLGATPDEKVALRFLDSYEILK